jgi:hypothetical protein
MDDETKGWVTFEMTDEQLDELVDPGLTRHVIKRNPGKIIESPRLAQGRIGSMDKTELQVSFVARTTNPDGFKEFLLSVLSEEYGVDIGDLEVRRIP